MRLWRLSTLVSVVAGVVLTLCFQQLGNPAGDAYVQVKRNEEACICNTHESKKLYTKLPSESKKLDTKFPSESKKLDTKLPSESKKLDTKFPSESKKLDTKLPSESKKLDTKLPSESKETYTKFPIPYNPATITPTTAEREKKLLKFLYPNNTVDINQDEEDLPKLLQQEYVYKKIVFVGVLTQQAYLYTRAKQLYETWGRKMDKLVFFVGEDCVVPPDLSYLPVIKLEGILDNVYPPLKKTFAVMTYMYDHFLGQYDWFIRADDDVYIRPKKLKQLLSNMAPSEKIYLGRGGTGRKEDMDRLHLLPQERYCMGGPGVILSVTALRELGPHLDRCLHAVLLYSKTEYNDDDVEIGRCISRNVGIQCSSSLETKTLFLNDYDGGALNPRILWTKKSFQNYISIHPLKMPENMLSVHQFYTTLDFEEEFKHLLKVSDYLNYLCSSKTSPSALFTSPGCDIKLHPYRVHFSELRLNRRTKGSKRKKKIHSKV